MDQAIEQVRKDYDAVPYESHAFPQTAPGHLAAIAYLFGLDVPAVSSARVLEIGCSAGGNLIPFAACHPRAHVVGVDLSQVQIDQGRLRVQALGLANVDLLQGDIATMDVAALGEFDFIVCHGVYSWVPENVQRAILSTFQQLLTPDGIAYLSYNVYPGWKAKEIVRDAMLLRGGDLGTPETKLTYARGMIDFLEEVAPSDSVLAKALADFRAQTANVKDYYLLHEYLEAFNTPCYFLKMVTHAKEHGLTYLADAAPSTMFAVNYGSKISEPLLQECGHSQLLVEQYLDFFVNRTFRQSLLVRAERAERIRYQLDRARFGGLHFAIQSPPLGDETRLDRSTQEYAAQGGSIVTGNPVVKAALDALTARWPGTMSRRELVQEVRTRLGVAGVDAAADEEDRIDALLEHLIMCGHVRYRTEPVLSQAVSARIRIDEVARRMAGSARGDADAYTFNVWHEELLLSAVDRHLLPLLDGSRDSDALIEAVLGVVDDDLIRFERDGRRLTGEAELRDAVAEHVITLPERLAAMKLLRL